ncbi:PREDICTED: putative nuclease HARBI1 [Rhagoletis zephyria]|uniref:putative nuclease HARBI1 n=1 Tax=Rhagoletis zephyria TaxID=28612 RepID=UPI0008114AD8|nr:PREDICTED: putative nuclease HARBI1 [Rhagoletis zephyria]
MATCDAKYTFTSASIESYGSQRDGGLFQHSPFGQALLANELPLPPSFPLWIGSAEPFPYYFVGDAAFPLKTNLMRPFPGLRMSQSKSVFNYRLSRACRVIENAFGILTARWLVLRTTIECSPENCEKIVLACLALHNFVMLNDPKRWYCPEDFTENPEFQYVGI